VNRRAVSLGALALLAVGLVGCSGGDALAPDIDLPGRAPFQPPGRAPLVRPDTPGNDLIFKFGAGDVLETFPKTPEGNFLVHFTRSGLNAVPATDSDDSGVPDFVEEVALTYEQVLAHYKGTLGFRAPLSDEGLQDNGGDGRFDVYLVDFGKAADGNFARDACDQQNPDACAGYMIQENDFVGFSYPSTLIANRILGSHEFFHAIQAAYDSGQGRVVEEGTAVWATETFDPTLKDFEGFLDGYLDIPDRSLNAPLPGPVDPFSYGSAIFFQFLEERYGEGMIRTLWESCENGANGEADPDWFTELDPLLKERGKTTFADAYAEFATYNLFTGKFADPSRSYKAGASYPEVKIESAEAPHQEEKLRLFYASTHYYGVDPAGRGAMTAALVSADADATDGLTVLFAVQRGSTYEPVVKLTDLGAGTQKVDTSGADRFVVAIVNGLTEGDSRKPGLCIGDVDEVAACRTALGGPTPLTDDSAGCACREAPLPSAPPRGLSLAAAVLGMLAAARFARLRRRKAALQRHPC
jgi:hypothetical protein